MDIYKLPFLSGCLAAIATGVISYATGADSQAIYIRMVVMMLVFFAIGWYARSTIITIHKEVEEKKLEQKRLEEEQMRVKGEEELAAAAVKNPAAQNKQSYRLNLTADDTEEFTPMVMSKAVSSKLKG